VRLLHRTTRSVTPTEAGQRLLARLDPALREVVDALVDVTALQAEPAGTLRLNVPRPAARLLLAPMLAGFVAAHPRVHVEVMTDDSLADIVGDGFDAGVRFGESLAGDMAAVPIGPPQRFVCVAAPSYLVAHGVPPHHANCSAMPASAGAFRAAIAMPGSFSPTAGRWTSKSRDRWCSTTMR